MSPALETNRHSNDVELEHTSEDTQKKPNNGSGLVTETNSRVSLFGTGRFFEGLGLSSRINIGGNTTKRNKERGNTNDENETKQKRKGRRSKRERKGLLRIKAKQYRYSIKERQHMWRWGSESREVVGMCCSRRYGESGERSSPGGVTVTWCSCTLTSSSRSRERVPRLGRPVSKLAKLRVVKIDKSFKSCQYRVAFMSPTRTLKTLHLYLISKTRL